MQREVKIGLGVVAVAALAFGALRFGAGPAAKTGLDLALANLPPGWTATHGAVTYNALSGDARVDNLVLTHDDVIVFSAASILASGIAGVTADAPPRRIGRLIVKDASGLHVPHIGRLEFDGVEVDNIRRVFDPAFYLNGKPESAAAMTLLGGLDGSDVTVHVDVPPAANARGAPLVNAVDVHIAHMHQQSVSARQLDAAPTPQSWQDLTALAYLGGAVTYGATAASDVTETIPHIARLRLGNETVSGFKDGRVASAFVDDFSADIDAMGKQGPVRGRVTIGHMGLRDLDISRTIALLPALLRDPPGSAQLVNPSVRVGGYDVRSVSIDIAKSPLVTMASFAGSGQYPADGSQTGSAAMRGFKIDFTGRDVPPRTTAMLRTFGMSDFNIDFDEAGSYSPADSHLRLAQADVTLHGLGALRLTADIAGLNGGAGAAPQDRMAALRSIKLYAASLRWDDASLADRIFHTLSVQSGKPEAALRGQLAIPVATLAILMPEQPDAAAQVNRFLDKRHRLLITLTPPHPPVALADVVQAGAAEKAPLLGLAIKGE